MEGHIPCKFWYWLHPSCWFSLNFNLQAFLSHFFPFVFWPCLCQSQFSSKDSWLLSSWYGLLKLHLLRLLFMTHIHFLYPEVCPCTSSRNSIWGKVLWLGFGRLSSFEGCPTEFCLTLHRDFGCIRYRLWSKDTVLEWYLERVGLLDISRSFFCLFWSRL